MATFRLSGPAQSDLDDIWLYIAKDNPKAADDFVDSLCETFLRLASMPRMGRERRDLAPDVRSLPVEDYLIFYRPIQGGVEVVRVIHGARHIESVWHRARD